VETNTVFLSLKITGYLNLYAKTVKPGFLCKQDLVQKSACPFQMDAGGFIWL